MPFRCRRTGLDGAADGPFFEESLAYAEAGVGDDRELTLYHSPAWILSMCEQPGSPLVAMTEDQYLEMQQAEAEVMAERDTLAMRVEELEAEVASLRELSGAVDKVLSNGLLERLDERYSRKTGPKPGKTAA